MNAYRRLSDLADHPVLKQLLIGIVQEESIHSSFYWNVARVKLGETAFSRNLARFIIGKFWKPVGQGAKPEGEANYVIATLWPGKEGLDLFDQKIAQSYRALTGVSWFQGTD